MRSQDKVWTRKVAGSAKFKQSKSFKVSVFIQFI